MSRCTRCFRRPASFELIITWSRLCDRATRRASPGLDTDLSGLGLSFLYSGNVRFSFPSWPNGKTYQMLEDARELKTSGVDLVIGFVSHTDAMIYSRPAFGTQTVPLKRIIHRSGAAEELDVDGVTTRRLCGAKSCPGCSASFPLQSCRSPAPYLSDTRFRCN
jgi:Osmosensitive K+ channel His kinase sensor domain